MESILCVSEFDMDAAVSEDETTYTDSCITVSVAVISVAIGIVVALGLVVSVGIVVVGINVVDEEVIRMECVVPAKVAVPVDWVDRVCPGGTWGPIPKKLIDASRARSRELSCR